MSAQGKNDGVIGNRGARGKQGLPILETTSCKISKALR